MSDKASCNIARSRVSPPRGAKAKTARMAGRFRMTGGHIVAVLSSDALAREHRSSKLTLPLMEDERIRSCEESAEGRVQLETDRPVVEPS